MIKGFNVNVSTNWEIVTECWKRLILAQLHYKRPITAGEARKFTKNRNDGLAEECLRQMVEHGVASYYPEVSWAYESYYEIHIDRLLKYIDVVEEEDFEDIRYNHWTYITTLKHADRLYQEAINKNLGNEEVIDYIKKEIEKIVDKRYENEAKKRATAREAQIKRNQNRVRTRAIKKMDESGLTARLLRGEITLEQYELVIQKISQ